MNLFNIYLFEIKALILQIFPEINQSQSLLDKVVLEPPKKILETCRLMRQWLYLLILKGFFKCSKFNFNKIKITQRY